METPPVYTMNQPKKPKNTILYIVLSLVGLTAVCCGGVVFMMFFALKKAKNLVGCSMNFAMTLEATKKYARQHDGNLPPAKGWQDAILADFDAGGQKVSNFFGGSDPNGNLGCKGDQKSPDTGIAYNKDVAGKKLSDLPSNTIIFFEVKSTERNQALKYKPQSGMSPQFVENQPRQWLYITLGGQTPMSFGAQFGSDNQPTPEGDSSQTPDGAGNRESDKSSSSSSGTSEHKKSDSKSSSF